jgi:hypothetical protein
MVLRRGVLTVCFQQFVRLVDPDTLRSNPANARTPLGKMNVNLSGGCRCSISERLNPFRSASLDPR